jgi:hypothetical protein
LDESSGSSVNLVSEFLEALNKAGASVVNWRGVCLARETRWRCWGWFGAGPANAARPRGAQGLALRAVRRWPGRFSGPGRGQQRALGDDQIGQGEEHVQLGGILGQPR